MSSLRRVHYDPHRWLDHFFDIRGSLVREIFGRVLLCMVWSVVVVAIHKFVRPVGTSSTVHSLIGVALGLLLVFRTNASYDRFWEGRKLWGGIVNESRNLVRAANAMLVSSPASLHEIKRWVVAFAFASMHQLRGTPPGERDPEALREVAGAQHPALAAAARISAVLQKEKTAGRLSDYTQVALDQNVQLLVDYLGGCERIHRTPLPFAYVVHLRRALVVYCLSLPFALVDTFGWTTVLDVLFVSYVFFGIEEIGVEIEDPFGDDENDLPLEDICMNIQRTLEALS